MVVAFRRHTLPPINDYYTAPSPLRRSAEGLTQYD